MEHFIIYFSCIKYLSTITVRNVTKDTQPSSSCVPMYRRAKVDKVKGKGYNAMSCNSEAITGTAKNFAS